jgi:hypothetical protein
LQSLHSRERGRRPSRCKCIRRPERWKLGDRAVVRALCYRNVLTVVIAENRIKMSESLAIIRRDQNNLRLL